MRINPTTIAQAIVGLLMAFSALAAQAVDTRTVEHLLGQTTVPEQPGRVVVLQDHTLLLPLLELGFEPKAAAGRYTQSGDPHFRGTEAYNTEDIEFLGFFNEPDLEALVASDPDLIIGSSNHSYLYRLLSDIAPVVIVPTYETPVRDTSRRMAELVNRQDRYQALERGYQARVAEVRQSIGEPQRYSAVHLQLGNGRFKVYKSSPIEDVLNDLGFRRPEAWHDIDTEYEASIEALHRFDADIVIDTHEPLYKTREATERYRESAFWQSLFAIRQGQFLYGERSAWMAMSFASLHRVLDAIEGMFRKQSVVTKTTDPSGGPIRAVLLRP